MQDALNALNEKSADLTEGSAKVMVALNQINESLSSINMTEDRINELVSASSAIQSGLDNLTLGIAALKESSRLMKGNKWTLFKLEFSFFGWMILSAIIVGVIAMILEIILPVPFLVTLVESILTAFVTIYLYEMKLNVCVAVFYEELDYEDKYGNMQSQDEGM